MTGNLFGAKQIDDVNLTEVFANKFYNLSDKGKVVRLNKESIKKIWEQQIKLEDGLTVELVDFVILTSKNNEGKTVYFLKAISKDKKLETGAFFTPTKSGMRLGGKTCSCKGCADGCNLSISGDYCRCSSCFGNSICEKTETQTVGLTPEYP